MWISAKMRAQGRRFKNRSFAQLQQARCKHSGRIRLTQRVFDEWRCTINTYGASRANNRL